jgi:hypothetical protein
MREKQCTKREGSLLRCHENARNAKNRSTDKKNDYRKFYIIKEKKTTTSLIYILIKKNHMNDINLD